MSEPTETNRSKNQTATAVRNSPTLAVTGGRKPPQAVDVERRVLGALLLEADALPKVSDLLEPELFYLPAHSAIYEAIQTLFRDQAPVDITTVIQQLEKMGKLEAVGGPAYITELSFQVVSGANVEYHTRMLIEKFLKREMISMTGELQRKAFDESEDVFELLDKAEQQLYELSGNNLRRESQNMAVLSKKVIAYLEELQNTGGGITGVPSGFYELDKMTSGWQKSDLIIVAGRPGMGKTAFVLSIASNAAIEHKRPVAIFSLEMAAQQLATRLICSKAELSSEKVRRGDLNADEWTRLTRRIGPLSEAPIHIDDTPALSVYDLRAKCRRLHAEKNIELIIIDYLQLMSGESTKNSNREQEIAKISRALKQLAKELNVPVIALSQLSRQVEGRVGDKRPLLSDLRESGSIEQDADLVLFLYRAEYYNLTKDENDESTEGKAEIIVAKQRNGPNGTVNLDFQQQYTRFSNPANTPASSDPFNASQAQGGSAANTSKKFQPPNQEPSLGGPAPENRPQPTPPPPQSGEPSTKKGGKRSKHSMIVDSNANLPDPEDEDFEGDINVPY